MSGVVVQLTAQQLCGCPSGELQLWITNTLHDCYGTAYCCCSCLLLRVLYAWSCECTGWYRVGPFFEVAELVRRRQDKESGYDCHKGPIYLRSIISTARRDLMDPFWSPSRNDPIPRLYIVDMLGKTCTSR